MIAKRGLPEEVDVGEELAKHRGAMASGSGTRRRTPGIRLFMVVVFGVALLVGGALSLAAVNRSHAATAPRQDEAVANTLPPLTPYVPTAAASMAAIAPPAGAPTQADLSSRAAADLESQRFSGGFTGKEGDMSSKDAAGVAVADSDAQPGLLAKDLAPLKLRPSKATMLSDRNYLLTKGAMLDCGQQSMMVTDQPGMVTCYTTSDTYSANGHVVLVDAGSKIVGSYQHSLAQGQNRVFVAWERIETPKGVIIDLDSPGTDPLGAAGEPGEVDTHFWERFGGAIMLSLIGDAGDAGVQAVANRGNTDITLNNTSGTANEMSAEALRNTINIPPTLYKDAGDRVNIYVARDLDFSGVYDLKPE